MRSTLLFASLLLVASLSWSVPSISVVDVTANDHELRNVSSAYCDGIYEFILSNYPDSYNVIDSSARDRILKEQEFSLSDAADVASTVRIGKLLAADKLVFVDLRKQKDGYILSMRLVNATTGITEVISNQSKSSIEIMQDYVLGMIGHLFGLSSKQFYNEGLECSRLGKDSDALEYFEWAARMDPDFFEGFITLGDCYSSMGKNEKAIFAYRQAVQIDGDSWDAYDKLGRQLMANGRNAEALDAYRDYASRHAWDFRAKTQWGWLVYVVERDINKAIAMLSIVAGVHPADMVPLAVEYLNHLYVLSNNREAAYALYRKVSLEDPELASRINRIWHFK